MNDDSGLQPTQAPNQPPSAATGDVGRYRDAGDGAGRDLLLDRAVKLRSADGAHADDLQREARFLARLDHAGLPCVHDCVRGDGGALLVQRPVGGRTLTAAVVAAAAGETVPSIAGHTACALIFIKICDALVAAHLRGVVHRALVPDVIILGDDGQVLVDGWRTAMDELERPATLRFIANAPVPAALPLDGLHEDIRGLGICLYTALVRETPPRDSAGRLAETSFDAALHIPAPLEAVVRKAMASDAADGYRSVKELRAELERFLAGQAPQAYQPGRLTAVVHWMEVHRRAILATAAIVLLAAGITLGFTWNEVKTYAAWGPPLVDEQFKDNSWKDRWAVLGGPGGPGACEVRGGRLVTTADYDSYVVLKQRLSPPVAIEYTARMEADVRPGDLSVWWCEGSALEQGLGLQPYDQPGFFIQAGAYENSWCSLVQVPGSSRLAVANRQLATGVDHRIRVEIEDTRIRMWVDGAIAIDHAVTFPAISGNIGLYGYFPGKQFDDVRVWQREVPELISPLAIGDDSYRAGRFADAVTAYGRVAASHSGSALGQRAIYLQGLASRQLGDRDAALRSWQRLQDGPLKQLSDCLAVDDLAQAGELPLAAERFNWLWDQRPAMHGELRDRWQMVGQRLLNRTPPEPQQIDSWLAVRQRCFSADQSSAWLAATMLVRLERWDDVVQHFANEHRQLARALIGLSRGPEILASDWAASNERIMAMVVAGDLAQALVSPHIHRDMRNAILDKTGRGAEVADDAARPNAVRQGNAEAVLAAGTAPPALIRDALLVTGRWQEAAGDGVPATPGSGGDDRAMLLVGRLDEAAKLGVDVSYYRLLLALRAGDLVEARRLRPLAHGNSDGHDYDRWFAEGIGLALADAALGDTQALRLALERGSHVRGAWGGRLQAVCGASLLPSDEAIEKLQWTPELPAWRSVARAMRAELAGDRQAALDAWRAFRALPYTERLLEDRSLNIELEATALWRISALGG